jgi:hypothetical protein
MLIIGKIKNKINNNLNFYMSRNYLSLNSVNCKSFEIDFNI